MKNGRKFGWKPSFPDHRVKKYSLHPESEIYQTFPTSIDLRPQMSPIEDQGQLGSCVAHATCAMLEFLELKEIATQIVGPEEVSDTPVPIFDSISRLFVYYNARLIDGDEDQDNGTTLTSAVQAIQKEGIARESMWPYDPALVNIRPAVNVYAEGTKHIVIQHYKINNALIDELKQCLSSLNPFFFGISVYSSFMSDEVAQSGIVPLPDSSEELEGGHALCCVGYDDAQQSFIVRNSWGTSWGQEGYCLIPYSYLTNLDLASDFWTIRNDNGSNPAQI